MSAELSAVVGFAVAAAASFAAMPVAIAIAQRTDFYDHPREYRKHAAATPLLGGTAVLFAFLVAALSVGALSGRLLALPVCAIGLWLIGTLDDRFAVAPRWRLAADTLAGI